MVVCGRFSVEFAGFLDLSFQGQSLQLAVLAWRSAVNDAKASMKLEAGIGMPGLRATADTNEQNPGVYQ